MADRAGQQLGNYKLVRLLGRGGFAEVYLGEHTRLGTQAAIKVLSTQLATEDEAIFQQEARTIAALEHPHIVRVLDFDVQEGTPFLVMSYAANGTLRTRHPRGSQLAPETILPYVKQVAEALQYAHDEKLIHRDIKPENMLLGKRQEVLLSDFGIATVAQSSRYQGTQEVAGTVAYMAPEQVQGKPRQASDQYSLAITIYEWLAGERPFHGSFTEIATQHVLTPPPPLREKLPDLSPTVEQAVLIALSKDPKERFASILAFATALEQAQQANASIHFAPTRVMRPSVSLDPTIAVTPANAPAAAYLPTVLPAKPAAQRRPTQSPAFKGATLLTYRGHRDWVWAVAWSPDGKWIASGSYDKTIHIWDAQSGSLLHTYQGHSWMVTGVAWSPDGRFIVSLDITSRVILWEPASGKTLAYLGPKSSNVANPQSVRTMSLSPNGLYLALTLSDKTIQIWNTQTASNVITYSRHSKEAPALSWSPESRYVASGGQEKTIHLWDAQTGTHLLAYRGHKSPVTALAWSPDGAYIVSSSDEGAIHLWYASGEQLLTQPAYSKAISDLAWSPDGKYIASIGADSSLQIWNGTNVVHLFTYRGHVQPVTAASWSPDGTRIASAGKDKTVQIWSIGGDK